MEVKGYKVFNPDWTCRNKQYTCPGDFREEVDLKVCGHGMHFCKKASDCFNHYRFDSFNRVAEVIAHGQVLESGDKCCTDHLEVVREITWAELLTIVNEGKDCTGLCNTGDCNTGNCNTGNWNNGNRNTGNWNTGNCNTGNRNTGDWNTGNRNTGNCNTGNRNTGDWNTGNWNTGNWNNGNRNTGNRNTGNCNTGNRNTGDWNTGNWNTGNWNTGNWNTGNRNTGNCNTGNRNTGNCNTGDCNTGNRNTGDWNKSSFNTGCFNTEEEKIRLFNKPSSWTYRDWFNSRACYLLNQIPKSVVEWVWTDDMTDEEKVQYPTHETTGGYLKVLDEPDCAVIWWGTLDDADKQTIMSIPNFDKAVFKEITGIDVEGE